MRSLLLAALLSPVVAAGYSQDAVCLLQVSASTSGAAPTKKASWEGRYAGVVAKHSNSEMKSFILEYLDKSNLQVVAGGEDNLEGLVPWYSGVVSTRPFKQLQLELSAVAWVAKKEQTTPVQHEEAAEQSALAAEKNVPAKKLSLAVEENAKAAEAAALKKKVEEAAVAEEQVRKDIGLSQSKLLAAVNAVNKAKKEVQVKTLAAQHAVDKQAQASAGVKKANTKWNELYRQLRELNALETSTAIEWKQQRAIAEEAIPEEASKRAALEELVRREAIAQKAAEAGAMEAAAATKRAQELAVLEAKAVEVSMQKKAMAEAAAKDEMKMKAELSRARAEEALAHNVSSTASARLSIANVSLVRLEANLSDVKLALEKQTAVAQRRADALQHLEDAATKALDDKAYALRSFEERTTLQKSAKQEVASNIAKEIVSRKELASKLFAAKKAEEIAMMSPLSEDVARISRDTQSANDQTTSGYVHSISADSIGERKMKAIENKPAQGFATKAIARPTDEAKEELSNSQLNVVENVVKAAQVVAKQLSFSSQANNGNGQNKPHFRDVRLSSAAAKNSKVVGIQSGDAIREKTLLGKSDNFASAQVVGVTKPLPDTGDKVKLRRRHKKKLARESKRKTNRTKSAELAASPVAKKPESVPTRDAVGNVKATSSLPKQRPEPVVQASQQKQQTTPEATEKPRQQLLPAQQNYDYDAGDEAVDPEQSLVPLTPAPAEAASPVQAPAAPAASHAHALNGLLKSSPDRGADAVLSDRKSLGESLALSVARSMGGTVDSTFELLNATQLLAMKEADCLEFVRQRSLSGKLLMIYGPDGKAHVRTAEQLKVIVESGQLGRFLLDTGAEETHADRIKATTSDAPVQQEEHVDTQEAPKPLNTAELVKMLASGSSSNSVKSKPIAATAAPTTPAVSAAPALAKAAPAASAAVLAAAVDASDGAKTENEQEQALAKQRQGMAEAAEAAAVVKEAARKQKQAQEEQQLRKERRKMHNFALKADLSKAGSFSAMA
eukprot:TRINITY_DN11299_c0_g1_i2.p1 TRINITY_DN11299_c0_g1~~TRINITY_DN11299_c0_g1_i2.p1  ORF type:complete len:1015 (-),score=285.90 TRINITY_DN11299_c0_g1_i2:714-3758(-)